MPDSSLESLSNGLILDIDRFSTHDGSGIRMAVFLKGCPLNCAWCHSPESRKAAPQLLYQVARCRSCGWCVKECPLAAITLHDDGGGISIDRKRCAHCFRCASICPTSALRIAGTMRSVDSIVEIARRDQSFYINSGGGVTVSGGEPLMQSSFVEALMKRLHEIPVHTALETSGQGDEDVLLRIAQQTDLIYYDIKLLDDDLHRQHVGVSNNRILSNLRALAAHDTIRSRVCVRTPCIPGINDSPDQIRAIAVFVRSLGIQMMETLPYNTMADAKYEWLDEPYPLKDLPERDAAYYRMLSELTAAEGLSRVIS
ncbi:glycyl-radical enzyme activating protein [Clostridia bacterium]|nr:glycyl-radical enzyme activating protein [Clostridia bacterium]